MKACGDVGAIASRIVAPTEDKATTLLELAEGTADTAFVMSTLHNKVYGHHSNSPIVYWKPGQSPYIDQHNDWYNPEAGIPFQQPRLRLELVLTPRERRPENDDPKYKPCRRLRGGPRAERCRPRTVSGLTGRLGLPADPNEFVRLVAGGIG